MTQVPQELDLEVGDGEALQPLEVGALPGDEDAMFQTLAGQAREPFLEVRPIREGDLLEVMSPSYRKAKVLKVQGLACKVECRVMVNDIDWQPGDKSLPRDNWHEQVWNEVWTVRSEQIQHPQNPGQWQTIRHCWGVQENRPKGRFESSLCTKTIIKVVRDGRPNRYFRVPEEWQPGGKGNAQEAPRQETQPEAPPSVEACSGLNEGTGSVGGPGARSSVEPGPEVNEVQAPKRKRGRPRKSDKAGVGAPTKAE